MYKPAVKYDDLIPKKQAFVDSYLESGDWADAYLKAGYKPSKRSHKANARKLYKELQPVINERMEQRVGEGAVLAFHIVRKLMLSAKSEQVQLAAAKDYLSRAGHDKPIEVSIDDLRDIKSAEIDQQIASLLEKATDKSIGPKSVDDQSKSA